ncbi:MAG: DEAD/DEAH box helicase [Planctomycetes bacterium]|nr:DEAD/DEAH box helicase [Planctomycetota bacterium]
MDAAYLHARSPEDARIAFFSAGGLTDVDAALPPEIVSACDDAEFEILLPTEEATLKPIGVAEARKGERLAKRRIAPALWKLPGRALPLAQAIPFLASYEPSVEQPGLSFLCRGATFVAGMLAKGEFAPADSQVLRFLPHWNPASIACLKALAEIAPTSLLTARFAAEDDPVYAVTPRNFAVSFVGHAISATAAGHESHNETADRLPESFWHTRPQPVIEVLVPERELEEGVPWAIQLLFRPIPGQTVGYPLEALEDRLSHDLFADPLARDGLTRLRAHLDEVSGKITALHRAMNMADGKASLNRQELDQLLDHLTLLENEGFVITLPGVEGMERLAARVTIAESSDGEVADSKQPWFEFKWSLAIGGKELSKDEFDTLLKAKSPLVYLDDQPILLTPKDRAALEEFGKRAADDGQKISFFDALRLKLGGATHLHGLAVETMETAPRLERLVESLEKAREIESRDVPEGFVGELRPYQNRGHAWIHYLVDQGFGACLADDMGLGKTIQAIVVVLDWIKNNNPTTPTLLVCPVSVLGNWRRELNRFAPQLTHVLHHGKQRPREPDAFVKSLEGVDVVLTSYNLLQRDQDLFLNTVWEGLILDEAQNIKNPATRQSKVARDLRGQFRLVLTGTPLENRPLDLWSIMDFLNEGLLGNRTTFLQSLEHPIVRQRSRSKASMLSRLVRPFVLRRLKTDTDIISDLPEKSEQICVTRLHPEQAALYEEVVRRGLEEVELAGEGIKRRGAILTTLLRLKQVCNHPAHYHGDGSALPNRSGKLDLLTEMVEEALSEGDRCLVFTQFKEMGSLLKTHIEEVIQSQVLFLHGGVPQKDREEMVNQFQTATDESPRVFVLSLKAGGTGLNLTAANRVFHFDRWWNPAVEDQATDRAFRIGQRRNVFVHKFVCTGTLEERIQEMLELKRDVANTLLGAGESWLTELSNDELKKLLLLDRQEALA